MNCARKQTRRKERLMWSPEAINRLARAANEWLACREELDESDGSDLSHAAIDRATQDLREAILRIDE